MLEKPDFPNAKIAACVRDVYGLPVAQVDFLPLGADGNTAVYRVTSNQTNYFLKLRGGIFDETSVTLPQSLNAQGISQIIAPLATKSGQFWTNLEAYTVILYPFVEGRNGYEVNLSEHHWRELGAALKRVHTAVIPPSITSHIRRENYSAQWRESVKSSLALAAANEFADPVAAQAAELLRARQAEILELVGRTEKLAQVLPAQSPEFIVCHSDLHAGNILVDEGHDTFYIVDWDEPILALKERDLMAAGAGLMGGWRSPQEEEALFYEGYGTTAVNQAALAYYRYERIIQDIAIYCEELLLSDEGGADRAQSLYYLQSNFWPNGTIVVAYRADRT
ncbi:MAG: phosphotransferase [Ardenticatenaceae bacterium]|nr:phosphotransferase [Ardenticatenaceae bacterium]MCB9442898.1 phosphotransferase [Ardenticatenaceae bacterium]